MNLKISAKKISGMKQRDKKEKDRREESGKALIIKGEGLMCT